MPNPSPTSRPATTASKAAFGIEGLDDILTGGLVRDRLYLLEGPPGTGKTTIALQFLRAGVVAGERVLYVTLSESEDELRAVADSHGWDLDGVEIRESISGEGQLDPAEQSTIFYPSEVELSETTKAILSDVELLQPSRVVFDSLSELRLLAGDSLRYRRQILALKQYFAGRRCTVLVLDDMTATEQDLQVHSIAHGVIRLDQQASDYGSIRRRLIVTKFRGVQFRDGWHDCRITRGGMVVYPRLVAAEHVRSLRLERLPSGIETLDELLGGGLERGTSTLFTGAPGTGKSSFAIQFAHAAAKRGENAALFLFDESINTLLTRAQALGMDVVPCIDAGRLHFRQVDPAELSPGEFVHLVRDAVTQKNARVVVIDSLNGYLNAMPDERYLIIQLHELLTYLGQCGVATVLVGAHSGLIGGAMQARVDASYLADAVVLLRYFEAEGEVRQVISVVKKRGSLHERTIREYRLGRDGLWIGPPLRGYRGVLTGTPVPIG